MATDPGETGGDDRTESFELPESRYLRPPGADDDTAEFAATDASATDVDAARAGAVAGGAPQVSSIAHWDGSDEHRSRRRRGALIAAAATAALVVGAGGYWYLDRDQGPRYRLAEVSRADVTQTVATAGTLVSLNQATVSFGVAGTVATVEANLGEQVKAGEQLARLDTTALSNAVSSARQSVTSAQQTLADDEAAQSGATTTAAVHTAGTAPVVLLATRRNAPAASSTAVLTAGSPSSALTSAQAAVRKAQQAVVAAQHRLDLDLAAASAALTAAQNTCQAVTAPVPSSSATTSASVGTSSSSAAPSSASSSTPASSTPASSSTDTSAITACQRELAAVSSAQQQVKTDEDALASAESTLNEAVGTLIALAGQSGSGSAGSRPGGRTGSTGGSSGQSGSGSSGSGTSGASGAGTRSGSGSGSLGSSSAGGSTSSSGRGSGSATTVVTAAQLAADQKAVDAANAGLAVAQQNLSRSAITSPISGRVGALSLRAGQTVSAGSQSATVTIVGAGQTAVDTTVSLTDIDTVKAGQSATVVVDGVSTPLKGTVSSVGLMSSSSDTGSVSYPVTITLDPVSRTLYDGAGAGVTIDTAVTRNVLSVPLSALHSFGTRYTVEVYQGGKVTNTGVTIGAVGTDLAQVTKGLTAGQQVVLARLGEPIPSSSVNGGFGRGGFGGGGGAFRRGG